VSVTDHRYFSGKISQSRNNGEPLSDSATTPDNCHHCREPFARGRMRYPIFTGVDRGCGWGLASVCMDCFKDECDYDEWIERECSGPEEKKLKRAVRKCAGCGEPIFTAIDARYFVAWSVCSNRCYQRAYRKRRRGRESVVDWKSESWYPRCESCGEKFQPTRRDARFCCNACRQRHYREHRANGGAR
jgi:predicted RNA-binding Zn-ribbon protein involved in translation (DUF1610 family)